MAKHISKLHGKRVLILGGTSGIGFGIAQASLANGAEVFVSSSNSARVQEAVDRLLAAYPEARVGGYACDLFDSTNIEKNLHTLLDQATDNGASKLNHVAFTAGDVLTGYGLGEVTVDTIHAAMAVRYIATIMLAKVLVPRYLDLSVENSFTLTTGAAVEKPMPGLTVMTGVGGAIEGSVKGLAVDLKPLRVNAVAPGPVRTERFGKRGLDGDAALEMLKSKIITGYIGEPDDAAEAYLYIMKDKCITGSIVKTNGGWLLV